MTDETFVSQLRGGESLVGCWSMVGHPIVAEVLASEGPDFVVLDGEHSENTISDIANGIRAIDATDAAVAPVVRASGVDSAELRRLLDLGPAGVIVPQIESVEGAREAVAATRYPPDGVRGVGGGRASDYGADIATTVAEANDRVATILQIETDSAVESIEDIAAVAGLDALFIGPADLSARLGSFGAFDDPDVRDAIDRIVAAAADAGVSVGTIATSPETVEERWAWGVDFMVVGVDVGYLRDGAGRYLDQFDRVRRDT